MLNRLKQLDQQLVLEVLWLWMKILILVKVLARIAKFYYHESCGQCTPCREGTGWLLKILNRILRGEGSVNDLDLLISVANNIEGNTICALGDAAAWPVKFMVMRFRDYFEDKSTEGNKITYC